MSQASFSNEIGGHSRRRGTVALTFTGYVLTGVSILQGLVLVPLYLHYIDKLLYGAWLATGGILSYFLLMDFGSNSIIIQKVGAAYGAGELPQLSRYLGSGLVMAFGLSVAAALLGVSIAPYLLRLIPVAPGEFHTLRTAFTIGIFSIAVMISGYAFGGILVALQRQLLHGLITVTASIIGLLTTLALLLSGSGLLALPLGNLTQAILVLSTEGIVFWRLRRQILPEACRLEVAWDTIIELAKPSGTIFLARGSTTLLRQSDNLIIGIFLDARAVLIYALTKRAFESLWMMVTHLVGGFGPALAHFFGELKGETAKARILTDTLIHVAVVLSLVLMGGYALLDQAFVGLWVGESFFAGNLVALLIGIYGILGAATMSLYQILFSRGYIHTAAVATGIEALLYLPLVAVMIKWLGLPGVALAGVLALAATGLWILSYRYLEEFHISWQDSFCLLKPVLLVGGGVLAIGLFLSQLAKPSTVLPFVLHGASYMAATSLWVLLVDGRIRRLLVDVLHRRSLKL
jgi:O-antigen/teichoic acid export membrane protein